MTVKDLNINFDERFDKKHSNSYAEIQDFQKDLIFNQALTNIIATRYSGNNYLRQGFEETEVRTDDLRYLVVSQVLTPKPGFGPYHGYGGFVNLLLQLPANYRFFLGSICSVIYNQCPSLQGILVKVTTDEIASAMTDPLNCPKRLWILEYVNQDNIGLVLDPLTTLVSYTLTYLRDPLPIITNRSTWGTDTIDLPLHMHYALLEAALEIADETVESPRQQTQPTINNKQE